MKNNIKNFIYSMSFKVILLAMLICSTCTSICGIFFCNYMDNVATNLAENNLKDLAASFGAELDKAYEENPDMTFEELEAIYNNPPHRYNTMSPMLNKMIGGWKENSFNLLVSSSGTGKSMMCFSNIAHGFASKLYVDGKWVDNKGLNENKVLYIGTHMDLHEECLPQIACCIGGLDYNRFLEGEFTEEEEKQNDQLKDLLGDQEAELPEEENHFRLDSL